MACSVCVTPGLSGAPGDGSWATISGNELLESGQLEDGTFRYVIRKA